MAKFALLNSENKVTAVEVISDTYAGNETQLSIDSGLVYKEVTDDMPVKPGIGFTYIPALDIFYPPRPYQSWSLNAFGIWEPPVPKPAGLEDAYIWNETTQSWLTEPLSLESLHARVYALEQQ